MAFSVTCPECGTILKSATPIPKGKKVKCPKCGTAFTSPALEEASAVSTKPLPHKAGGADEIPEGDEEAPRPRKRRAESDDEDEAPRRKRDRRADDEAEENDRPARKRKRKKSSVGMLIGLILGGGFALLAGCAGCGGLGYWLYTLADKNRNPIVGTWEHTNHPLGLKPVNTFGKDGQGSTRLPNITISYRYRLEGNQLTIEPSQPIGIPLPKGLQVVERYTVTFNGNDEMVLSPLQNQPLMVGPQRFRRLN